MIGLCFCSFQPLGIVMMYKTLGNRMQGLRDENIFELNRREKLFVYFLIFCNLVLLVFQICSYYEFGNKETNSFFDWVNVLLYIAQLVPFIVFMVMLAFQLKSQVHSVYEEVRIRLIIVLVISFVCVIGRMVLFILAEMVP